MPFPHLTQITRPISSPHQMSYMPVWSPDGRRMAVWRDGHIWVIRADGSHARPVGVTADEFTWSADGKWIVFSEKSLYAVLSVSVPLQTSWPGVLGRIALCASLAALTSVAFAAAAAGPAP